MKDILRGLDKKVQSSKVRSLDDIDISKKTKKNSVTVSKVSDDSQLSYSQDTLDINLPVDFEDISDRLTSLSNQQILYQLDLYLDHLQSLNTDQYFFLSTDYGVIETILETHPVLAKLLLEARLRELKKTKTSWFFRSSICDEVQKLQDELKDGHLLSVIKKIDTIEKRQYGTTFFQKINQRLTQDKQYRDHSLLSDFSQQSWLESIATDSCLNSVVDQKQLYLSDTQLELENLLSSQTINPKHIQNPDHLLNYLIFNCPRVLSKYIENYCSFGIYQYKKILLDPNKKLDKHDKEDLCLLQSQFRHIHEIRVNSFNSLINRSKIKAFLKDKKNLDLKETLHQILIDTYLSKVHVEIMDTDYSNLNDIEALDQLKEKVDSFQLIHKFYSSDDVSLCQTVTNMDNNLNSFVKSLSIYKAILAENSKENRSLYKLKPPSFARIFEIINSKHESTEKQLYLSVDQLIYASHEFISLKNNDNLISFQNAKLKFLQCQQAQVEFEIRAKLKSQDHLIVTTEGNFDQDLEMLKSIYSFKEAMITSYPEMSKKNVIKILKTTFWDQEQTIDQIVMNLYHDKTLKELNYNMGSELLSFFDSVDCSDTEALGKAVRNISEPTYEMVTSWKEGKGSIWNVLKLPLKTYKAIEQEARAMVENVLAVAERNPRQFRQLFGDVSLIIDQLKCLVGSGNAGLIDQLKNTLSAQSMAACFSGNEADITQVEPDSDLAKNIKKFQLLCDLSHFALHGSVLSNSIKTVFSGNANNVFGYIGAGISGCLFGLTAAPVGMALLGHAWNTGTNMFNVAGTYAIRNTTNSMDSEQIKILDKLVNYGPMFLNATSPYDTAANFLRNFGKGDSLPTIIARTAIKSILSPFSKLATAIKSVYHKEEGAWKKLGIELAVFIGTIALAAAVATAVYFLVISIGFGSPILVSLLVGLACTYKASHGIDLLRRRKLSFDKALNYFNDILFSQDNIASQKILKSCEEEADKLVSIVYQKDLLQQNLIEEKSLILYQAHWDNWTNENLELSRSYLHYMYNELEKTKDARLQLSKQIHNSMKIIDIANQAMGESDSIVNNKQALQELKLTLSDLGLSSDNINEKTLIWDLEDIKEQQKNIIIAQCNTENPGQTLEEINKTLEDFYIKIFLGHKLFELLDLSDKELTDIEKKAEENIRSSLLQRTSKAYQLRTTLLIKRALSNVITEHNKNGQELFENDLNSSEFKLRVATEINHEQSFVQLSIENQILDFQKEFNNSDIFSSASETTKKQFFDRILRITGTKDSNV